MKELKSRFWKKKSSYGDLIRAWYEKVHWSHTKFRS